MEIKSKFTNRAGETLDFVYRDAESLLEIADKNVHASGAFCFYGDKLVIVFAPSKGHWTLPGGGVEKNESAEEAIVREVEEETNMRVAAKRIIGYLDVYHSGGIWTLARFACIVEPIGPFTKDPDGDITEIKLIDPKDFSQFINWVEVGDHLVERALELKQRLS